MIAGRFGEIGELIFEIELIGADTERYPLEVLDEREFIIPVIAGTGILEPLLGLQWLKMLPLAVNFSAGVLTLG